MAPKTVMVPGTHEATIDLSGLYELAQGWQSLAQIFQAFGDPTLPHTDAGARSCVAHHSAHASRASNTFGSCASLGAVDPYDLALTAVGWGTDWFDPEFLAPAHYLARSYQCTLAVNALTFAAVAAASPSWLAAAQGVLPPGQESMAVLGAAATLFDATVSFSLSGGSGVGVDLVRRTDAATTWVGPSDVPGSTVDTTTVTGSGSLSGQASDLLDVETRWLFLCTQVLSESDLGYDAGGEYINTCSVSGATALCTFRGSVTYDDPSIFGVPPLHASQRRGGTDAHAAHARGADTRQSRLLARGPL